MTFPLNATMFDLLVLSVIAGEDAYGYQISQIIKKAAGTKDSALYPVLRRLQENRYVEAYDRQYQGRNRRYYSITEAGRLCLEELTDEWERYKTAIDDIIKGGMHHDQD